MAWGIAAGVSAFGLAWWLTGRVLRWAAQRLVDVPNARSSHERPTPRGGGIAIVTVVLGGVAVYAATAGEWRLLVPYLVAAGLVAGISLLDDFRSLSTVTRLAAHATAALLVMVTVTDGRGIRLPFVDGAAADVLAPVLTFLWIVGLTNAYNFMDGIDGIAAAQGVIAGVAWGALGLILAQPAIALIGVLAAAGSAGFMLHNWPPARIFMGDVGAAFLGFTFAVLPLLAGGSVHLGAAAVLVVGSFVFDATFTIMRRAARGENVFQAHRSHLYQRLVIAGRTHRAVTTLYAGLATALAAAGVAAAVVPARLLPVLLAAGAAAGTGLWLLVRHTEHGRRPTAFDRVSGRAG